MTVSTHMLRRRRFLPLFVTQLLGAFNDNLYKTAMVLFVVYEVYRSEEAEGIFSAVASGVFILPFFVLSALAGQLADMRALANRPVEPVSVPAPTPASAAGTASPTLPLDIP